MSQDSKGRHGPGRVSAVPELPTRPSLSVLTRNLQRRGRMTGMEYPPPRDGQKKVYRTKVVAKKIVTANTHPYKHIYFVVGDIYPKCMSLSLFIWPLQDWPSIRSLCRCSLCHPPGHFRFNCPCYFCHPPAARPRCGLSGSRECQHLLFSFSILPPPSHLHQTSSVNGAQARRRYYPSP